MLKEAVAVVPKCYRSNLARSGTPCFGLLSEQLALASYHERACLATCLRSKRISDLLVGVHHDSDAGADSAGWEVLDELATNQAALSVGRGDFAPDALVVDTSLLVLGSVDEADALTVIAHR